MLANEAIARAVVESDVKVAAFYPGSPTSEILDTVSMLSKEFKDLTMEVSANEKVAFETAVGASLAGVRSFTSMKSVGLNVASDAFFSVGYTGLRGGMVLLIADDPHAHSSQSEQDGRFYAYPAHVPMLEPSTAQEAYDMTKWGFELSEKYGCLVLVRTTTRVNHQSAIVSVGEIERTPLHRTSWKEVGAHYYTLAATARRLKGEALERLSWIREEFENSPFNAVEPGEGDIGIITSGVSYLYVREALETMDVKPHVLKLGTTHPLPTELIGSFLADKRRVVVVEELMPYLEREVKQIAFDTRCEVEIRGKLTGDFPTVGEYNVPIVRTGITSSLDMPLEERYADITARAEKLKEGMPTRSPIFCPGCPHRGTFWAVQQALNETSYVLNNDIGCYSMFLLEPYEVTDSLLCMGASLGLSSGMQHVLNDKVVAFVGDSTFFHAAIPGLLSAVHNNHNFTLVILNNSVTAMTGQQPNPGSDFGAAPVTKLDIAAVVKGLGVPHVAEIQAFEPKDNVDTIKEALAYRGVSVVVSHGPCALYNDRLKRHAGTPIIPNEVSHDTCQNIYACIRSVHCPAIELDTATGKSVIRPDLCDGCMVCAKMCPVSAIYSTKGDDQ
jgi:indolepyruvate ferredoxin oxidoreductase alpha subunit